MTFTCVCTTYVLYHSPVVQQLCTAINQLTSIQTVVSSRLFKASEGCVGNPVGTGTGLLFLLSFYTLSRRPHASQLAHDLAIRSCMNGMTQALFKHRSPLTHQYDRHNIHGNLSRNLHFIFLMMRWGGGEQNGPSHMP